MTIDVKAGSFTASAVQSTNTPVTSGNGLSSGSSVIRADSAQALVKISASNKLSGSQKSGLIQDIAVVDRFASENTNLRKTLLNDVARSTVAMERSSTAVQPQPVQKPEQVAAQYVEARKKANSVDNGSARLQQDIQRRAQEISAQTSNRSLTEVSVAEVEAELNTVSNDSIRRVQEAVEIQIKPQVAQSKIDVSDTVEIRGVPAGQSSERISYSNEVRVPGSGSTVEREAIPLPGAGSAEVETIPLPGSGDVQEIALPGSGSVELDAIPLPGSGNAVESIDLPGAGSSDVEAVPLPGSAPVASEEFVAEQAAVELVSQTVELIDASPVEAEAAVVELELPGRVLSGAEAEEQQAALRRVLQSL